MSEVRYDLCSVGRRLAPSLLNELVYLAWDSIIALLLSLSLFCLLSFPRSLSMKNSVVGKGAAAVSFERSRHFNAARGANYSNR